MGKERVLSGMRPTGRLHLGHLSGALKNWIQLQTKYECFFMVADWHALMSEYEESAHIKEYIIDCVADWLACGIDPDRCHIFRQSSIKEHAELHIVLSIITPLGWLERCPTYKEQLKEMVTRQLATYGFLGYPVLQASDILLYKATHVPVGEDQLAHLELVREIARRFNHIFKKEAFESPASILTKTPKLLGIDGRKMSKSYGNAINLSDSPEEIRKKVASMFTDPARLTKSDPGHPAICNVYHYYQVFCPKKAPEVWDYCSNAKKGCVECKDYLADILIKHISPIRERRLKLLKSISKLEDILYEGSKAAHRIAKQTMEEVKEYTGL